MTRSMILAILAFCLLILANLAVFGFLSFGSLSEKMVTEKLMAGLHEARQLVSQQARDFCGEPGDELSFSRRIAPRLRKFAYFQAILILDEKGNVLLREKIQAGMVSQSTDQPVGEPEKTGSLLMIPVQNSAAALPGGNRVALEYNADTVRQEVESLRRDLNRKLGFGIIASLLLLTLGLIYVIWAYKRNQSLQMRARAADRLAYVGTLASGLAHEIRNPLNSMNMNVQLIQEELEEAGLGDNEILDMLNSTRGEIRRLEQMVSSFIAYARPTPLQVQPCQVNDLVIDIVQFLGPEIDEREVNLVMRLDPKLPEISIDANQIKQALINIIQNGLHVLSSHKTLEIETRKAAGDKVLVSIRDEGPGISEEERKNIFKVFYSTKRGGTGLGLPTAQRVVERHNGGIKVESRIGRGTTFTIILPMEIIAA